MKRFKLLALAALLAVPTLTLSVGCRGEVDEDGADLEVGAAPRQVEVAA